MKLSDPGGELIGVDGLTVDGFDLRPDGRDHHVVVRQPLRNLPPDLQALVRLGRVLLTRDVQVIEFLDVGRGLAALLAVGGEVQPGHRRPRAFVGGQVIFRDTATPGGAIVPVQGGHDLIGGLALIPQRLVDDFDLDMQASLLNLCLH